MPILILSCVATMSCIIAMIYIGMVGNLREDQKSRDKAKLFLNCLAFGAFISATVTGLWAYQTFGDTKQAMKDAANEWWQERGPEVVDLAMTKLKEKAKDAGKETIGAAWEKAKDWAANRAAGNAENDAPEAPVSDEQNPSRLDRATNWVRDRLNGNEDDD